jgi:hypothetical protein
MRSQRCIAIVFSLVLFSLSSVFSFALDQTSPAAQLPTGLRIPATLKTSLSSKKAKVGDPVRLEVVVDVHDKTGAVAIPKRATLYGKVTSVVPYEKKKQPATLSFVVDRAEWKGQTVALDGAVFGTDVRASDSKKSEVVEGVRVATLRTGDTLNLTSLDVMLQLRLDGDAPMEDHDQAIRSVIMQLKIVADPAIRTAFVSDKGDVDLHSNYLIVLLNGMKLVE